MLAILPFATAVLCAGAGAAPPGAADAPIAAAREMQALRAVNRHFNAYAYRSDRALWSRDDYWATPVEFESRRGGDCEDFAIAKYFALVELGFDPDRLFLTYARVVGRSAPHMVLSYYPALEGAPVVLDNFVGAILSADDREDLVRIYDFNARSAYLVRGGARTPLPVHDAAPGSREWRDLLGRVAGTPVNVALAFLPAAR